MCFDKGGRKSKKSYSACILMSNSFWPHGLLPISLLCPWDSSGKNTVVACHFLLPGSSWPRNWPHILRLLHWQVDSFPLHHMGSPKKKPYTHLLNWIWGWNNSYIAFMKDPYGEFIKYLIKNNADILQTLSYSSRVDILPKLFHKTNLTMKPDLDKNTIYKENCRQISTVSIDMECRTKYQTECNNTKTH